jgi:hypothetical protein
MRDGRPVVHPLDIVHGLAPGQWEAEHPELDVWDTIEMLGYWQKMPLSQKAHRRRHPRQHLPDGLRTLAQGAEKLACSLKTLRGHIASGALRYVIIGHGTKRPRKFLTDEYLAEFIANQTRKDVPCPSTASRARHSGTSISSGEVVAFTARPKSPRGAKPKK